MKIPLEIVFENMEGFSRVLLSGEGKLWYQAARYSQELVGTEGVLLVGKEEEFPSNFRGQEIVVTGPLSKSFAQYNRVLHFPHNENPEELLPAIQKIFLRFHHWDDSLRHAIQEEESLETLFRLSGDIFGNPIFIHDENFFLLASENQLENIKEWEYDEVQGSYVLSLEVLNDFKVNSDYLDTMNTHGPSIFPETTFGYKILYINLWYNGQYRGRICVNEMSRDIRPGDFYLLDYFSRQVMENYKSSERAVLGYNRSLAHMLARLIEGEIIEVRTLDKILMPYDWTVRDEYFCICLFPEKRDTDINAVRYFSSRLSEESKHICVFPYDKCIVALVNSTMSEMTIASFRSSIAVMLREGLIKAGISSICRDLSMFAYYYEQAINAFQVGHRKEETFWSYCFDDYQTEYVLGRALEKFPAKMLCSNELLLLETYDKDHTSELFKTLRIYLEQDRNLARTADILDIHRSTLLYRIGRIQELTRLQLDIPQVKFRLLLSFHLLDNNLS